MNELRKKRLGDLLVESGKITNGQLEQILNKQKSSGKRLGELIIEDGILSEDEILNFLEVQLGIERVYIDMINVDKKAIMSVPESLAAKYNLLPLQFKGVKIVVAMSDPLNIFAMDDVKIATGYEVEPLIASKEEIRRSIDKYYSDRYVQKAAEDLSKERQQTEKEEDINIDDIKNAPAVRLVDSIIKNAIELRASDIHIEPFEKYIRIRYRIDGQLQEVLKPAKETLAALVTRIKILSDLNIAERRIPQDGRILTKVDNKEVDLRVSILPTVHGEKVVIRILSRDNFMIGKSNLGMNDEELQKLSRILKNPYGIILVTGPTGSGKSTTLYTILSDLNSADKNIITVEDPVEYMLEGVNQVNVNTKAGLTFAAGLRSILRQDPDIIMIGEIRDGETAEIATRAAITGHLVVSTLHTNDAPSSVLRLVDMGIEPYLVATSIAGVISQRLVRKICPQCDSIYNATSYEKKLLGIEPHEELKLHRGQGCVYCSNTGYVGRTGVYEIMEITRQHRDYIMENKNSEGLRDISLENGMKTLNMSCRELVIKGITTVDELVRIAYLKE